VAPGDTVGDVALAAAVECVLVDEGESSRLFLDSDNDLLASSFAALSKAIVARLASAFVLDPIGNVDFL